MPAELHFDAGTLVGLGLPGDAELDRLLVNDPRSGVRRAPAFAYRPIVERLHALKAKFDDRARAYQALELTAGPMQPWPHQRAALDAWVARGSRGIVELPTGSGKTLL